MQPNHLDSHLNVRPTSDYGTNQAPSLACGFGNPDTWEWQCTGVEVTNYQLQALTMHHCALKQLQHAVPIGVTVNLGKVMPHYRPVCPGLVLQAPIYTPLGHIERAVHICLQTLQNFGRAIEWVKEFAIDCNTLFSNIARTLETKGAAAFGDGTHTSCPAPNRVRVRVLKGTATHKRGVQYVIKDVLAAKVKYWNADGTRHIACAA